MFRARMMTIMGHYSFKIKRNDLFKLRRRRRKIQRRLKPIDKMSPWLVFKNQVSPERWFIVPQSNQVDCSWIALNNWSRKILILLKWVAASSSSSSSSSRWLTLDPFQLIVKCWFVPTPTQALLNRWWWPAAAAWRSTRKRGKEEEI